MQTTPDHSGKAHSSLDSDQADQSHTRTEDPARKQLNKSPPKGPKLPEIASLNCGLYDQDLADSYRPSANTMHVLWKHTPELLPDVIASIRKRLQEHPVKELHIYDECYVEGTESTRRHHDFEINLKLKPYYKFLRPLEWPLRWLARAMNHEAPGLSIDSPPVNLIEPLREISREFGVKVRYKSIDINSDSPLTKLGFLAHNSWAYLAQTGQRPIAGLDPVRFRKERIDRYTRIGLESFAAFCSQRDGNMRAQLNSCLNQKDEKILNVVMTGAAHQKVARGANSYGAGLSIHRYSSELLEVLPERFKCTTGGITLVHNMQRIAAGREIDQTMLDSVSLANCVGNALRVIYSNGAAGLKPQDQDELQGLLTSLIIEALPDKRISELVDLAFDQINIEPDKTKSLDSVTRTPIQAWLTDQVQHPESSELPTNLLRLIERVHGELPAA